MFVAVGSASNVDDPDTHPGEKDRADILVCDPANCQLKVYAYGIRNAGGGIGVNPQTGELWCSVNERDALGDNLVPGLHHARAGRRILRMAVVVHRRRIRIRGIRGSIRS